jgi:hypothetical protein
MNKKMMMIIGALSIVIMSSKCGKDVVPVENPVLNTITVTDLPSDTIIGVNSITMQPFGAGKYTFYSLERNQIVANSDSATNKWDIAFSGTRILTNSGTSFNAGIGGGFVFQGIFDNLNSISVDSIFKIDAAPSSYAITFGSGRAWYSYDGPTNLINIIPGRVLCIKTASGKYAKVEMLNYYKGGTTPLPSASDAEKFTKQRFLKFRYIYQPNGTKLF